MARSTGGTSTYPWAAPPSRVVRTEEALGLFRAEKGAFHDLVTSSCTSGKKGTGAVADVRPAPPGTNHPALSAREKADAYSAARCSQRPGKHSGQFWIWLGQRYSSWRRQRSQSSSPEPSSSPDAVIQPVICWGTEWDAGPRPVRGPRILIREPQTVRCAEEWEARGGTRRGSSHCNPQSPWPWAEVVLRPEELERGRARGIPPV